MQWCISLALFPQIDIHLLLQQERQHLGALVQDADVQWCHAEAVRGVDIELWVLLRGDERLEEVQIVCPAGKEELFLCCGSYGAGDMGWSV